MAATSIAFYIGRLEDFVIDANQVNTTAGMWIDVNSGYGGLHGALVNGGMGVKPPVHFTRGSGSSLFNGGVFLWVLHIPGTT